MANEFLSVAKSRRRIPARAGCISRFSAQINDQQQNRWYEDGPLKGPLLRSIVHLVQVPLEISLLIELPTDLMDGSMCSRSILPASAQPGCPRVQQLRRSENGTLLILDRREGARLGDTHENA